MKEVHLRVMNYQERIQKNTSMSKTIKALAGVCLFFSFCYSRGSVNLDEENQIQARVMWIISMIVLLVLFYIDSNYVKKNKTYEFEIYKLEVEDLNDKKEIAEITGEILPDYVLNTRIDVPTDKVLLPITYYSVILVLNIIIAIMFLR